MKQLECNELNGKIRKFILARFETIALERIPTDILLYNKISNNSFVVFRCQGNMNFKCTHTHKYALMMHRFALIFFEAGFLFL